MQVKKFFLSSLCVDVFPVFVLQQKNGSKPFYQASAICSKEREEQIRVIKEFEEKTTAFLCIVIDSFTFFFSPFKMCVRVVQIFFVVLA